jgi:hypothetical protein
MAYTYDPIFAYDPGNPSVVASNAAVLIYDPADTGKAPIVITDTTGSPLPNPITVSKQGMGPAFQHPTLDRVAWEGGGLSNYFTSYEGMKTVATDAQVAAEAAQAAAETAGVDAAASAALVGAPSDSAVQTLINAPASATRVKLDATFAAKSMETSKQDVATLDAAVTAKINDGASAARAALNSTFATVLGNSNGTDDTATINAALTAARTNGKGYVQGKRGENYRIPGELIIGSDTVLDLSGCTLTKPNGNTNRMIRNYADTQTAATGTAATTSGSNVITTALASSAVIGQTIHILDAGGNGGGPLVGVIESINTGAGTLTVLTLDGRPEKATATVSGKTAKLFNRDRNITIKVGTQDAGNNTVSSSLTHGFIYARHVDGIRIEVDRYVATGTGRGIGIGDVTNSWTRMNDVSTTSVGYQVSGPANNVHLDYIAGSAGDDLVAFTAGDYPDQQATAGDITNITVGNLFARDSHLNLFKLLSGAGRFIGKVKVMGALTGTGRGQGVCIGDDIYMPQTTGGTYGDIDLGTVDLQSTSYSIALNGPAIKTLRIRSVFDPSSPTHVGTPVSIAGSSTATIKNLIIAGTITGRTEGIVTIASAAMTVDRIILDKMHIEPNNLSTIFKAVTLTGAATVGDVVFNECTGTFIGQTQYLVYAATGTVKNIHFRGGTITNGNCLVYLQAAAGATIWLSGTAVTGAGRIANILSNATIILENPVISTTGAAVYLSSATLTVSGSCLSAFVVQKAATETLRMNGITLKSDITVLTPADGDMVFNTNGSAAGGGTAVFSAGIGKWKGLYSGTTYP